MAHMLHCDGGGNVNFRSVECFKSVLIGSFDGEKDVCLSVLKVCFFENSMRVIYCTVFLTFLHVILKKI